jgi:hypothetical protein
MFEAKDRTVLALGLRTYAHFTRGLDTVEAMLQAQRRTGFEGRSDQQIVHGYTHCPRCDRLHIDEDILGHCQVNALRADFFPPSRV